MIRPTLRIQKHKIINSLLADQYKEKENSSEIICSTELTQVYVHINCKFFL